MNYIKVFFCVLLIVALQSCNNKFKCGYDPKLYKVKSAFKIDSLEFMKIEPEALVNEFEQYGVDNGFCIANGSQNESEFKRYLINIQIVKSATSFHLYGFNGFTISYSEKLNSTISSEEKSKMCDFIASYYEKDKAKYFKNDESFCEKESM